MTHTVSLGYLWSGLGVRCSNKLTFSKEQSAGIPTEVAVTLHASFRLFMTCSLIIPLVNMQTIDLGPGIAFRLGTRWPMSMS